MLRYKSLLWSLLLCLWVTHGPVENVRAADTGSTPKPYLLHLPGIGGHMRIDDLLLSGLRSGGLDAEVEIYDWTGQISGLAALVNYERNQQESQKIADKLTAIARANPERRIIITSHSGGGGLAVWALERVPDDVQIDALLLIAPALSPQYDMSRALSRVRGQVFALVSELDPVLGTGTRNFGTIDRVMSDSAGRVGFTPPADASAEQYRKLQALCYDRAWTKYGNAGDHIGAMNRAFARNVIAPLLMTGRLPAVVPASRPTTQALRE